MPNSCVVPKSRDDGGQCSKHSHRTRGIVKVSSGEAGLVRVCQTAAAARVFARADVVRTVFEGSCKRLKCQAFDLSGGTPRRRFSGWSHPAKQLLVETVRIPPLCQHVNHSTHLVLWFEPVKGKNSGQPTPNCQRALTNNVGFAL